MNKRKGLIIKRLFFVVFQDRSMYKTMVWGNKYLSITTNLFVQF